MSKLEKAFNLLTPKLSEAERAERMAIAVSVAQGLVNDPEWSGWITGIYVFGSTVKGKARKGSDIDLAIRTKQDFFFGMDFSFNHHRLSEDIEAAKAQLGINPKLKINPQIVAETWLANPDGQNNAEFLKELLETGILIYEK